MRVMVLGGTRFIGAAIVEELHAHGHELLIVHRGEHEPADLPEADHLHAQRQDLPTCAARSTSSTPRRWSTSAPTRPPTPRPPWPVGDDVRLLVVSSMDVYRAFGAVLAGTETDALPVDETSPVRPERYPYRGRPHPSADTDTYEKLDVEAAYLAGRPPCAGSRWSTASATTSAARSRSCAGSGPARAHPGRVGRLAVDPRVRPRRRRRHPPGPGVGRLRGRDPQPGRGPHLVDGPVGPHVLEAAGSGPSWSGSPTSSSPTTSRPSAPSPSTSWSTPPRPATCSAGPRPTPTRPSTARSPGTWPTRQRTRTPTSAPTTAPWPRP